MRPILSSSLLLALIAAPAIADETTGEVLAYDRLANRLVLEDRTIWELGSTTVPTDLAAGDVVTVEFTTAGDNGVGTIVSLTRVE